jgi:hypothetical protein
MKSHEVALHGHSKEIEMLRRELSEYEMMIFRLCMKGMFAFCYVCSRVKSVEYRLLQCDVLSVEMFMHVCLDV